MSSEATPAPARVRRVIQLTLVALSAGVLALAMFQLWSLTGSSLAFYIGMVTAVVTALALLGEFATAVAPQVESIRRTFL